MHRSRRDQVHTRIVWKGGDTTTIQVPIAVGSLAELSHGAELEQQVLTLYRQGYNDQAIAQQARLFAVGIHRFFLLFPQKTLSLAHLLPTRSLLNSMNRLKLICRDHLRL